MTALSHWLAARLPLEARVHQHALQEAHRRAKELGLDDASMVDRLTRIPDELDRILELTVPPESWLFRHAPAFEALRAWLGEQAGRPVRMASLGCARGAEPCSMAATAASVGRTAVDTRIVAVDWNARHLAEARAGHGSPLSQRGPVPDWAQPALRPDAQGWLRLQDDPMRMIEWVHADILHDPLPGPFDVVFCRNVAIYLGPTARRTLAARLRDLTARDGLLFVGHADPTNLWEGHFHALGVPGAFGVARTGRPSAQEQPSRRDVRVQPPLAPSEASGPLFHAEQHADTDQDVLAKAQALADAGELEPSEACLRSLLQRQPMHAEAWSLLGAVLLAQAHPAQAEACFHKSVYLRPDPLTLLQLAALAAVRGDTAAAERFRMRAERCATGEAA